MTKRQEIIEVIKNNMEKAMYNYENDLEWICYIVEPIAMKYRIPIDFDLRTRKWWFIMKEE